MSKPTARPRPARAAWSALLALALCATAASNADAALTLQKSVTTAPGTTVRLNSHMHFAFATCQALSVPRIIIEQQPSKGTLSVTEGVAELRTSFSEKGEGCVGRQMRAAVLIYTPFANATGEDTVTYQVRFPHSCNNCTNFEMTVKISIEEEMSGAPDEATHASF